MAGGIDQAFATSLLVGCSPNSGTGTFPTVTGPIKVKLMTANGSDTAAGTELATSGGYTAGGLGETLGTPSAGSVTTTAAASWTNMPATTLTGVEEVSSDGTPKRMFWGPFSSGNIAVASGNTFTIASGSLSNAIS